MGIKKMVYNLFKLFIISSLFIACGEVEEFFSDLEEVADPTNSDTTTTISPITTTTIEPTPTNPVCNGTFYPPDGLGGFVWKPESESNGNLVVLLPGNFQKKFNSCKVYDGKVADSLNFASFGNYDGQHNNQLRQQWRGNRPGSQYNSPALVVCNDGNQDCAWQVKTPWDRVD